MMNRTHDTVLDAPYEMTDKATELRRQLTQRELRIANHTYDVVYDSTETSVESCETAVAIAQANYDDVKEFPATNKAAAAARTLHGAQLALAGAIGNRYREMAMTGFASGQVDGYRLAFRLITRILTGKVDEFHNVTADQLPLLLAGALTDDEQAAELIGRIATGQL